MKISDRTRRLLLLAAGASIVVGGGVAVSSFVLDDGDPGLAAVTASDSGADAPEAGGDDYSLRDVTCNNNIFDEPLAKGELVNIAESNRQFRVSVVFRDGDREVGHGMKLLDELAPGDSEDWAIWVDREFEGSGLDCDVRVEDAS